MSSGITYKIGGKYDPTGEKKAVAGIGNIKNAVNSVNNIFKAFVGVKIIEGLNKVVAGSTDSFLNQNKALKNYEIAISKANLSLERINNLRTSLSRNNLIDDDTLNNAMALGANMGLSADQMDRVMNAAADLTASGIMPMDQAVKTLSQTYAGTTGQLGKLLPEVKNLTKEELASGDAVALVTEKYKGYADAVANTFNGRESQFKNAFGDLQSAVGGIIQSLKFLSEGELLAPLNNITNWLVDNRNEILKFFISLPSVGSEALSMINDVLVKTFTPEGISNLLTMVLKLATSAVETACSLVVDTVVTLLNTIKDIFDDYSWDDLWTDFKNSVSKAVNWVVDKFPNFAEKVGFTTAASALSSGGSGKLSADKFLNSFSTNISNLLKNYKTTITDSTEEQLGILTTFADYYKVDVTDAITKIQNIIKNTELPPDLLNALNILTGLPSGNGNNGITSEDKDYKKAMLSKLGEVGTIIQGGMEGGVIGAIASIVGIILSKISSISDKVGEVFNFISTILNEVLGEGKALTNIIKTSIEPIAPVLKLIGKMIDLMFKTIEPVFVNVFNNILKAVLSVINIVLTGIYNAVVAIRNSIVWWGDDWEYLSLDETVAPIFEDSPSTSDYSTVAGGSASYTAARDTYVTINFNGPTLGTGDSESMAVYLAREIKRAEAMNLV